MPSDRTIEAVAAPLRRMSAAAGAALIVGLAGFAVPAAANDLVVRYDQSSLLRLPRNVGEVIIGNPSIADVTVQGGNMLVVTGKTFGITNVIALDSERNVIQDQRIVVQRDDDGIVNLVRAGSRQSFTCTPECSPTLTIGDETTYFDMISRHASVKTKFSDSSSEGSGGQQGSQ